MGPIIGRSLNMRASSKILATTALALALSGCVPEEDPAMVDTSSDEPVAPDDSNVDPQESYEPDEPEPSQLARADGPSDGSCDWEYEGENLVGNRGSGLPVETLQVVLFHDGVGSPSLEIGLEGGTSITIGDGAPGGEILDFGQGIETRQYRLYNCVPDGTFAVSGHEPNGVVDGLGYGLLWRDENGTYEMIKSEAPQSPESASFVGMWPLGMNDATFAERTPQITDSFGRESAQAILFGAELVPNGNYGDPATHGSPS